MNNLWKQTIETLKELENMVSKMDVVNMNKVVNNNSNVSTKYPYINDEPALMQKQ